MKLLQIDGNEIEINPQSELAKAHFADPKNYAEVIAEEFSHNPFKGYLKPDSVVLDIGANIGLFALHVMPFCARIVCIEPTPEHMRIQKELLGEYFNYDGDQSALNSFNGTALFRKEPVNTTMNSLTSGGDGIYVCCSTLLQFCELYTLTSVDFCKIDIEGGEFAAITIVRVNEVKGIIKAFWLETHPRDMQSMNHFKVIFEACGYEVELIDFNGTVFAWK